MRLERFLPEAYLSGDEWMAPRQLAFGTRAAVVPQPTRISRAELGLVQASEGDIELTQRGAEALRLGDR